MVKIITEKREKIPMPVEHRARSEKEWLEIIMGDASLDVLSEVDQNLLNKQDYD